MWLASVFLGHLPRVLTQQKEAALNHSAGRLCDETGIERKAQEFGSLPPVRHRTNGPFRLEERACRIASMTPENEPPQSDGRPVSIRRGTVIRLVVEVRAENDCEVHRDVLIGVAEGATDALLNHAPDLSTKALGYHIARSHRKIRLHRRTKVNPRIRQRETDIPEPLAGGNPN